MEYTSGRLFDLAEEFGIPLRFGSLEDEPFLQFRTRYLEWSNSRDQALADHLVANPQLFRVHLPYNREVLHLASQIVWYFDEIVIWDPVAVQLSEKRENIEEHKSEVRDAVEILLQLREPIEAGYLLLGASKLFSPLPERPKEIVAGILEAEEVRASLIADCHFGFASEQDAEGIPFQRYQLRLGSRTFIGLEITVPGKTTICVPLWRVGTDLPRVSYDELIQKLGGKSQQVDNNLEGLFVNEVSRVLKSTERAYQLAASVLFPANAPEAILQRAETRVNPRHQMSTVGVLNLTLPYTQGLPPARLTDLRDRMPDAFIEFRHRMCDIVTEAITRHEATPETVSARVNGEVVSQLRTLETERDTALHRAGLLGLGLPLVSATGMLAGYMLGAPLFLVAGGVAGMAAGVKAEADIRAAERKAAGHPFYFLWKARRMQSANPDQ